MPSSLSARSWQLPAAAVFATMATSIGLSRLIHPGAWVAVLLLVSVLLAGSGMGLRRLGTARPLIVLIQAVVVLCVLTAILAHTTAIAGFVPGPAALRLLGQKFSQGGADLRSLAPPTPDTPGITTLMAVSGACFAFIVDVLAVTCRRPILAGAPILAVYLIPATREPGGLNWLAFVMAAAGYLALVGTDGHERLGQWGRAVQRRSARPTLGGATNAGLTRQIAAWAIGAALLVPLLIPATPRLLDFDEGGDGSGGGAGTGTIYLNQTVNIAQDLASPRAIPLFEYRTTAQDPMREYLQQEVLTQFNGTEWDPSGQVVPVAPGEAVVPGLSGASGVSTRTVDLSVDVNGNFGFSTVPTPYATTNVTGLPDVTIDSQTLTAYVNDRDDRSRAGTHYETVSTEVTPTQAQLMEATAGQTKSAQSYLSLPASVRALLTQDAQNITSGDVTPYQQAMALQDYFQSNFTYTLTPQISGTGVSAIESFLKTKAGFCQQFAATMAAMARALGIPAVVAVGYTPGTVQPDGSYQVTTHDAHAWPMLFFDGIGWVQFEPTPKIVGGRAQPQPWTVTQTQANPTASKAQSTAPTARASATASSPNCTAPALPGRKRLGQVAPTACAGDDANANAAPRPAFAALGPFGAIPRAFERWFLTGNAAQIVVKLLALALALLTCLPAAFRLRRWRRRRRLLRRAARRPRATLPDQRSSVESDGGARSPALSPSVSAVRRELAFTAWEELREYASDLGYGWPESDTPRQLAGRLAVQAEFDPESAEAVGRVTTLVERAVYSPEPEIDEDEARALPGDLSRVRTALAVAAGRAARLRAAVLPSSSIDQLLRRRGRHH
jgi:transglutaminase-like putative cysteine protease